MSRPPKPEHLKLLHGTARKDRARQAPTPVPGLPICPSDLTDEAKREWKRIVKLLDEAGVLSKLDRAAVASYCQFYARWMEAERQLTEDDYVLPAPNGVLQPNPLIGIANKANEQMRAYLTEFGLTPASRSRIHVEPPKKQETNPFKAIG